MIDIILLRNDYKVENMTDIMVFMKAIIQYDGHMVYCLENVVVSRIPVGEFCRFFNMKVFL